MATTKRLKSVGKDDTPYLMNAAKMTPYEVDIHERLIYVPETELDLAGEDMIVQHLCNSYKFHIQSCIPTETEKKEVYNPQLSNRVPVRKEPEISPYKVGALYRVQSTNNILNIVRTEKGKIELAYVTWDERLRRPANLLSSTEHFEQSLRKETIKPYTQ